MSFRAASSSVPTMVMERQLAARVNVSDRSGIKLLRGQRLCITMRYVAPVPQGPSARSSSGRAHTRVFARLSTDASVSSARTPDKIVLFAEDVDVIDRCRLDVPIDRGPSREEYA